MDGSFGETDKATAIGPSSPGACWDWAALFFFFFLLLDV